jgi:hypothetical protein
MPPGKATRKPVSAVRPLNFGNIVVKPETGARSLSTIEVGHQPSRG